jgi:hypothetical protein
MTIGSAISCTSERDNPIEGPGMTKLKNCHDGASYKKSVSDCKERNIVDRRTPCDRRTRKSKGSAYISIVGWICRREQARRKNDRFVC